MKKVSFGVLPVCMDVHLSSAWIDGQIILIVDIQEFILLGWCPLNENILSPKIGTFQMGPKTPNGDFPKNNSNEFD
jgi:hypothetical protein